jgi:hypothetical protein
MTFGGLRDKIEEALQARDEAEWRRLFDIYRSSIELLEKKDPDLAALSSAPACESRSGVLQGQAMSNPERI